MDSVVQAEWSPKGAHALIPGTCEDVTAYGDKDLAAVS
jgi:hypothetical protein